MGRSVTSWMQSIIHLRVSTSSASGNVYAISQDQAEGAALKPGSVVTVRFGDSSVLD